MNFDLVIMAKTIYGEARGCTRLGRVAVAHVIMNRYHRPGWWTRHPNDNVEDDTIAAACIDPFQFSCWNAGDPNLRKIALINESQNLTYLECLAIAADVINGHIPDPTSGSCHYHTDAVRPNWAKADPKTGAPAPLPIFQDGNHLFYNNVR